MMSNITIDDLKKIGWVPQVEYKVEYKHDTLLRYGNTHWYIDYSNTYKTIFSIYESPSIDVDYNFIFQYKDKPITFVELVKLMDDNYIV